MAVAFATVADLTGRGATVSDSTLADVFLQDASDFLRGEIGWQVYPAAQATFTQRGCGRRERIHLPGAPIRSVTSVTVDGATVDPAAYELVDNALQLGYWYPEAGWPLLLRGGLGVVAVTYSVGYDTPPPELVSWTCVLAAEELARAADSGGERSSRPQSESLGDWRVVYSQRQQAGDLPIPDRVLQRLRSTYGATAFVT